MKKPRSERGFCLARKVGIEPTTIRLTVERSTAELLPNTVCTFVLKKCNTKVLGLQDRFLKDTSFNCAEGYISRFIVEFCGSGLLWWLQVLKA